MAGSYKYIVRGWQTLQISRAYWEYSLSGSATAFYCTIAAAEGRESTSQLSRQSAVWHWNRSRKQPESVESAKAANRAN